MKTLEHQTLLYDEDCPLCQAYTSSFIKTGMLDKNGRKSFNQISTIDKSIIDIERASNEIALIDTKNKTVTYGINSLLKVIGHRFPIINTIGHFPPVHYTLELLYAFISYNRKVIMPNKENKSLSPQCIPSFNNPYRLAYIFIAIIITSSTVVSYLKLNSWVPNLRWSTISALTLGLVIFQWLFIIKRDHFSIINYLGHVMTVSLYGSLILLPVILVHAWIPIPEFLKTSWFSLTIIIMFFEHKRRVKLLSLPAYLSYTWVLYRIIILVSLLILFL